MQKAAQWWSFISKSLVSILRYRSGGLCLLVFESQMSSLTGIAAQHKRSYISISAGVISETQEPWWVATCAVKISVDFYQLEAHVAFQPECGRMEQEQTFTNSHGKEVGDVQYSQLIFCFRNNLSYRISVTATKPFLEVKQPCWWAGRSWRKEVGKTVIGVYLPFSQLDFTSCST